MMKGLILAVAIGSIAIAQESHRFSISPIAAVSRYVLDDHITIGPMIGVRFQSREFSSNAVGVSLGVILRPNGFVEYGSEPFTYHDPQPLYQLQPPLASRVMRQTRFGLGLGFFGFDWRTYLADGDIRPYVGAGASLIGWPSASSYAGTISPDIHAGVDVHLSRGVNAFAEAQYLFGSPTLFGSSGSSLSNITTLALGISFAPRW
ncbi:MAG: hypothetical protein WBD36_00355 [Bacteroidota bacterium]